MNYDPDIHHRRSIRMKGYYYSQKGLYFITICKHNRLILFGRINEDGMEINDSGRMVETWWHRLPAKFPNIHLCDFIVMPNHIHGILQIRYPLNNEDIVGADTQVHPYIVSGTKFSAIEFMQ